MNKPKLSFCVLAFVMLIAGVHSYAQNARVVNIDIKQVKGEFNRSYNFCVSALRVVIPNDSERYLAADQYEAEDFSRWSK